MLNFLNSRFRYIRARHNLPYSRPDVQVETLVTSIVIPCTGEDYIEEAKLSALFAARFATAVQEIVIVSDQPDAAFGDLLAKTHVVTLAVPQREEGYAYKQIYRSRLIKIQAPLQAKGDGILMNDSDLNLL
ncbi:Glycosyltransferase involved in cell wall biosynthesis|nr:Glycosyltransferase involved in cell wall biosynthesis [Candidatus Pantoea persica]